MIKNTPANAGDTGDVSSIPDSGRSPKQQPTPVFLPGKYHEQRSLMGYSPWGHKESDMTKQLSVRVHVHTRTHTRENNLIMQCVMLSIYEFATCCRIFVSKPLSSGTI